MKKLLFLFMMLLSLCACSSDDNNKGVRNVLSIDGKEHTIDKVVLQNNRFAKFYADGYEFSVNNLDLVKGKKSYLADIYDTQVLLFEIDETGNYLSNGMHIILNSTDLDKSSFIYLKDNEEDTRTYIEVYVRTNKHVFTVTYSGVPQNK